MERTSLNKRKAQEAADDSEEDIPLMQRKKPKKEKESKKRVKAESEGEEDFKPVITYTVINALKPESNFIQGKENKKEV
jgi:hypothetical protein